MNRPPSGRNSTLRLLRFGAVSLSSSAVDLGLFTLLTALLSARTSADILAATATARIVSGLWNFLLNRRWVFRTKKAVGRQAIGYAVLFCAQLLLSALLVWAISFLPAPLVAVKMLVDGTLFLLSYQIQKRVIFNDTAGLAPVSVITNTRNPRKESP